MPLNINSKQPLIAHVIFRFGVGGLENGLVNIVNNLPKGRYRHAVICLTESGSFADRIVARNVPVFELHKRNGKDPLIYVELWRLLRKLRPSVLHTRNLGAIDLTLIGRLAGVTRIVHGEHGWDAADPHGESNKYRYLRKFCDRFVTEYVVVSKDIGRWLSQSISSRKGRVSQIYNGVDSRKFTPTGSKAALPFKGRKEDLIIVGTIGRMDPIKNFDILISAVQKILQVRPELGSMLRLVMIGEGPMVAEYRLKVAQAGLDRITWFAGRRDDIPDLLRAMDIFVLPSRNEGISNTILEAMATGLPIIATDVGGNSELIDDKVTGLLIRPNDVDVLSNAISGYANNPSVRERHGNAARKCAETKFALNEMVRAYAEVYDRLLGSDGRAVLE